MLLPLDNCNIILQHNTHSYFLKYNCFNMWGTWLESIQEVCRHDTLKVTCQVDFTSVRTFFSVMEWWRFILPQTLWPTAEALLPANKTKFITLTMSLQNTKGKSQDWCFCNNCYRKTFSNQEGMNLGFVHPCIFTHSNESTN